MCDQAGRRAGAVAEWARSVTANSSAGWRVSNPTPPIRERSTWEGIPPRPTARASRSVRLPRMFCASRRHLANARLCTSFAVRRITGANLAGSRSVRQNTAYTAASRDHKSASRGDGSRVTERSGQPAPPRRATVADQPVQRCFPVRGRRRCRADDGRPSFPAPGRLAGSTLRALQLGLVRRSATGQR